MTDETLEQSTLEQEPTLKDVMREFVKINKRLDAYDAQFEAVRQGLVDISVRLDRVESIALATRANLTQLTEEVRHNRKVSV